METHMTKILVTGGTGLLGGQIVPQVRAAGHEVRVLSRSARPAAASHESDTDDGHVCRLSAARYSQLSLTAIGSVP